MGGRRGRSRRERDVRGAAMHMLVIILEASAQRKVADVAAWGRSGIG